MKTNGTEGLRIRSRPPRSFVVEDKATRKPLLETFSVQAACVWSANDKCRVWEIGKWLGELNQRIRNDDE